MNLMVCPIYRIFGVPCLACGTTRAYKLFLTGHIKEAFLMHPLFLLPIIFLFPKFRKKRILLAVIGIYIAVYIVRFCILFPHTPPFNFNENSLLGELIK